MTPESDLDTLIRYFGRGYDYRLPKSTEEKRLLLRSLMNVRMPGPEDGSILGIQDGYLRRRAEERGITDSSSIPRISSFSSANPFADRIAIWQGDITLLRIGAIVNAANSRMIGCFVPLHACIDNCIHTYAGIQLREECRRRMSEYSAENGPDWPTAVPMLTGGYNLPAENIIHVVGPIAGEGTQEENDRDLRDCYLRTLDMCLDKDLKSVAFCCISTGVFRFPNKRAAEIAVQTVNDWMKKHPDSMERVIFNVFKDEDKKFYEELIR